MVRADNSVEVAETDERLLQRVYATDNFYGSGKPRFESVMLQGGTTVRGGYKYNVVIFGKALGFVTLKAKERMGPNSDLCILHNTKDCADCSMTMSEELVLVQCYDVIGDACVPKDNVDKTLDCIRLKWERHGEESEGREAGKVYALCPLDSVRDRVHVLRCNAMIDLLHDNVPYRGAMLEEIRGSSDWQEDIFYVNRFYFHDHDVRFKCRD